MKKLKICQSQTRKRRRAQRGRKKDTEDGCRQAKAFEKRAWKGKATEGNSLRKYRQNIQFDEGMIVL